MNHEEILAQMKALTEEIKSREGTLTEGELEGFLESVSSSLGEVFNIAQQQIDHGMEQIAKAQNQLIENDMASEAATMSPLLESMNSVKSQLEIGREVSRQKRDFQGYAAVPQPERVLTPSVLKSLLTLERTLRRQGS